MNKPSINSYGDAARFLAQSPERGTGQRGTKVLRLTPTEIAVRYHQTDVVVYHHPAVGDRVATLNHGGWVTPTTRSRMNEYAPEGVSVRIERGRMLVQHDGQEQEIDSTFIIRR